MLGARRCLWTPSRFWLFGGISQVCAEGQLAIRRPDRDFVKKYFKFQSKSRSENTKDGAKSRNFWLQHLTNKKNDRLDQVVRMAQTSIAAQNIEPCRPADVTSRQHHHAQVSRGLTPNTVFLCFQDIFVAEICAQSRWFEWSKPRPPQTNIELSRTAEVP
jgi:hypothetical protein